MVDGFSHWNDLLGSLLLLDVVGPQDDPDGVVQRVSGRWGGSQEV